MTKWKPLILAIITTILLTTVVTANIDTCAGIILPNETCTAITPPINCNTYELYNSTGTLLTSGTMTHFNGSMYTFNFTRPEGEYIAKLCDNSTAREFVVGVSEEMANISFGMIILPILISFLFLYLGHTMGDEHDIIKWFFRGISLIFVWISYQVIYAMAALHPSLNSFLDAFNIRIVGYIFYIFFAYFMMFILYKIVLTFRKDTGGKGLDRREYRL